MSKITISAVLTVLRLAIGLTQKIIRLIYVVMDLVDDGCVNASVVRPDWMQFLVSALNTFESLGAELSSVEDSVYEESNAKS